MRSLVSHHSVIPPKWQHSLHLLLPFGMRAFCVITQVINEGT